MKTVEERREQLEDRLRELDARMHEIEDELESHHSPDWQELAIEREEDEVLEQMGTSSQKEVTAIRHALHRMDEGEYGYCVRCGNRISEERLDLLPHTPFCKDCAAQVAQGRPAG